MDNESLNECNCGDNSAAPENSLPRFNKEISGMEGKNVLLTDGRTGLIDDAIRNSRGEIIGYVLTGKTGSPFRVYKDKIDKVLNVQEQFDGAATLDATPGMGEIVAPTADHDGSGDKFSPSPIKSKKNKKSALLSWDNFLKQAKKSQ